MHLSSFAYMKHICFLSLILLLGSSPSLAQNEMIPRSCIKLNMLSPVMSTLNLAFETQTAEDYSVQLGVAFMNHPTYANTDGLTRAVFLTPEFRYKLADTKQGYAFIGVFGRYINMKYEQSETHFLLTSKSTSQYESVGAGLIIGQKLVYKKRVALEFFGGPVYSGIVSSKNDFFNRGNKDITIDQDVPYTLLRRYGIRAGFTIGWLF